jgi:fermentation-respiration switch protein FrsA (DUF1100 family)
MPAALLNKLSLENQVNPLVPPTFLWHTIGDAVVPAENTLLFVWALQERKTPMESHIYDSGRTVFLHATSSPPAAAFMSTAT